DPRIDRSASSGAKLHRPCLPNTEIATVCDRERITIIFNLAAGNEESDVRRAGLEDAARSAGLTAQLQETSVDRGAGPLSMQAISDGMERVIVSGGDGSVADAAHV